MLSFTDSVSVMTRSIFKNFGNFIVSFFVVATSNPESINPLIKWLALNPD